LVERFHGMEEVWGSIPHSSTKRLLAPHPDVGWGVFVARNVSTKRPSRPRISRVAAGARVRKSVGVAVDFHPVFVVLVADRFEVIRTDRMEDIVDSCTSTENGFATSTPHDESGQPPRRQKPNDRRTGSIDHRHRLRTSSVESNFGRYPMQQRLIVAPGSK
jgi:hypothetical protein